MTNMTEREIFEFTGRTLAGAPYGPLEVEYQVEKDFTQDPREWALVSACLNYHCRSFSSGGGPASGSFPGMPRDLYVRHFRRKFLHKAHLWGTTEDLDHALWFLNAEGVRMEWVIEYAIDRRIEEYGSGRRYKLSDLGVLLDHAISGERDDTVREIAQRVVARVREGWPEAGWEDWLELFWDFERTELLIPGLGALVPCIRTAAQAKGAELSPYVIAELAAFEQRHEGSFDADTIRKTIERPGGDRGAP